MQQSSANGKTYTHRKNQLETELEASDFSRDRISNEQHKYSTTVATNNMGPLRLGPASGWVGVKVIVGSFRSWAETVEEKHCLLAHNEEQNEAYGPRLVREIKYGITVQAYQSSDSCLAAHWGLSD